MPNDVVEAAVDAYWPERAYIARIEVEQRAPRGLKADIKVRENGLGDLPGRRERHRGPGVELVARSCPVPVMWRRVSLNSVCA